MNSNLHFTANMHRGNFAWLFLFILVSDGLQLMICVPGKLLSSKITHLFNFSSLHFLFFLHFKTNSFAFASVDTDEKQENYSKKSALPFARQYEEVCPRTPSNESQVIF